MTMSNTLSASPRPSRVYDETFQVTDSYRDSLPDLQNSGDQWIQGSAIPLIQVGIHGFKLPLQLSRPGAAPIAIEATVTGTVSLDAESKGINMSRIMRSFYDYEEIPFSLQSLGEILQHYRKTLKSCRARIRVDFQYPIRQTSLRSGLSGWQYYPSGYEGILNEEGIIDLYAHFRFTYSSACPCSSELSEHARENRGVYAIPHSQRSHADISLKIKENAILSLEDIQQICLNALKTETQVMVKREDEQAFAELNGAYVKFVEDAARLLYQGFTGEPRVTDFLIRCSHLESLHSHDAVAAVCKGIPGGFQADRADFKDLRS